MSGDAQRILNKDEFNLTYHAIKINKKLFNI